MIEQTASGAIVVTGQHDIRLFQLITWKHALKLEMLGLTRRGRSVYSIVKSELGFRGNRKRVLAQLEQYIDGYANRPLNIYPSEAK